METTNKITSKFTTRQLGISAILLAIAIVTDYITPIRLPYGGSFSFFTMLLLCLVGYLFGAKLGIMAGIAFGLITMFFGGFIMHPIQGLLDYPVAFGLLGITGFFSTKKYGLQIGYIVAVFLRYLAAVLSGVVFFASFAPDGTPVLLYSLGYNATYILPEMVISLIIISIPAVKNVLNKIKTESDHV